MEENDRRKNGDRVLEDGAKEGPSPDRQVLPTAGFGNQSESRNVADCSYGKRQGADGW